MQNGTRAGGLAVAVALHAAVILLLYLHRPEHHAEPVAETWIQLVKVQPPKPRPAPVVAAAAAPRPRQAAARPAPVRETTLVSVAPPPAEAAPAAVDKPIDMDAARRVAGEVAREENLRARTHPNVLKTERTTRQERLARAIENAHKPDCKTAYAGAGLFALIPLAKNALSSDPSCRW